MVPKASLIMAAFEHATPADAPSDIVAAMSFMLNMAVPAVDPNILKDRLWTKGKTTHLSFFGPAWKHEMATALLLVEKFSDVDNLLYNAGIINEKGEFLDCGTASPVKPIRKKRKKMHTKSESGTLARHYYKLCGYFGDLQKKEGFKERMAAWDLKCCDERGREPLHAPTDRVDTMAAEFGQSQGTDYFLAFLRDSDLENAFISVPTPPGAFATPPQRVVPPLGGGSPPSAADDLSSRTTSPVICDNVVAGTGV